MGKLKSKFFWVPNLITSLNLACGSVAVVLGIEGQLGWAAILIIIAAVFDFIDGFAARLLKSYSDIGKQLDSLADVISFGLAPACILMGMMKLSMFGFNLPVTEIEASPWQWILLFFPLIIPVAGAFRLAKFNIDTRQTENFLGLPIPANAMFHASLALITWYGQNTDINKLIMNQLMLVIVIVLFSCLMVSEIPMFSMKLRHTKWKGNQVRFIFAALCVVLVVTLKLYALPLIIISYVFISIISLVFTDQQA